eukprot:1843143-Rhodomonas_salina.1
MTLAGPCPIFAHGNPAPHRRQLKFGPDHRDVMVKLHPFGHVLLKGSHRRCPGLIMSLGAGIMECCAAIREVSRRLPFFQAVGADVRVGHPNSGKVRLSRVHARRYLVPHPRLTTRKAANRPQGRTNAFATAGEVRELGGSGKDEIVHAVMRELPYQTRHLLREPFPASRRGGVLRRVARVRAGVGRIRHGRRVGAISRECGRDRSNTGPELEGKGLQAFNGRIVVVSFSTGISRLVCRSIEGHAHVGFDLDQPDVPFPHR